MFMEIHLTTTECHLPYGITQCYLQPDTSEHTPSSQTGRYSIYRPFKDGGSSVQRRKEQLAHGCYATAQASETRDPNPRPSDR